MPEEDLAAAAASAPALRQVATLARWIGPGRKVTQTGQLTMADARHLVDLLETGVWSALSIRYYLDEATTEQLGHIRKATDRDLRRAAGELVAFGALAEDGETLRLSPAAEKVLRARFAAVQPEDQIAQIKVTLLDSDPPVWRRLLVPMTLRLDRLDRVIQAAMGWTNSHLHMFIHPSGHYGTPGLDFPMHDERKASFRDLAAREGDTFGYEYDFGDSWAHILELEDVLERDPDAPSARCLAGDRACPPA